VGTKWRIGTQWYQHRKLRKALLTQYLSLLWLSQIKYTSHFKWRIQSKNKYQHNKIFFWQQKLHYQFGLICCVLFVLYFV
jgi:hypothetical protein